MTHIGGLLITATGSVLLTAKEVKEVEGHIDQLKAENAKLRELVSDLMPIVCGGCHERLCEMPKEEHPFVECLFDCRMRDLGIEVGK